MTPLTSVGRSSENVTVISPLWANTTCPFRASPAAKRSAREMSVKAALPSVLCCEGVPGAVGAAGVPGAVGAAGVADAENEESKGNFERARTWPAGLLPRPEPRMIVPRFEPDDIGVAARLLAASNRPGGGRSPAVGAAGFGWLLGGVTDMIPTRKSA